MRRAASTRGSSLPTAANSPIRWLAGPVALRPGGTPDQLDQAPERVVDVTAEQVQVGHQRLRVHVVRALGRGRARGVEVGALGALQHLGHRQPAGRLGVGLVGVDQLLVLGHREVDVAGLERVLGGA